MSVEIYRINGRLEETDCDWCGCPLFHGDTAVQDGDTWSVYCSRTCHRRHADHDKGLLLPSWSIAAAKREGGAA
jgi:Zn-finger protein